MKNFIRSLALFLVAATAIAQVPNPQVPIGGTIGENGVNPLLPAGSFTAPDSNYTVTYPNTSCVVCVVTGSWTGPHTLTLPSSGGFVYNYSNTTGDVVTIAPSSGLTIANGTSKWIWYNGTAYVEIDPPAPPDGTYVEINPSGNQTINGSYALIGGEYYLSGNGDDCSVIHNVDICASTIESNSAGWSIDNYGVGTFLSISSDGGGVVSDGSGNFTVQHDLYGFNVEGNTVTADQGLNVEAGTTSLDGGNIYTDGSGNLTVGTSPINLNGLSGEITAATLTLPLTTLLVDGSASFANTAIQFDVNGDITMYGGSLTQNSAAENSFDGGSIVLGDGAGDGTANFANGTFQVLPSGEIGDGAGYWRINTPGDGSVAFDGGNFFSDGSGNVTSTTYKSTFVGYGSPTLTSSNGDVLISGSTNAAGSITGGGGEGGVDGVLTFTVASPHGWSCAFNDQTNDGSQTAYQYSSTTTTVSYTHTAPNAGDGDTISYACVGW